METDSCTLPRVQGGGKARARMKGTHGPGWAEPKRRATCAHLSSPSASGTQNAPAWDLQPPAQGPFRILSLPLRNQRQLVLHCSCCGEIKLAGSAEHHLCGLHGPHKLPQCSPLNTGVCSVFWASQHSARALEAAPWRSAWGGGGNLKSSNSVLPSQWSLLQRLSPDTDAKSSQSRRSTVLELES